MHLSNSQARVPGVKIVSDVNFHEYLYDNDLRLSPTFILDATGECGIDSLRDSNFIIKYKSGLSRRHECETEECTGLSDVIKAISVSVTAEKCPLIDGVGVSEASKWTPAFAGSISKQLLQSHGKTAKNLRKA